MRSKEDSFEVHYHEQRSALHVQAQNIYQLQVDNEERKMDVYLLYICYRFKHLFHRELFNLK